VESKIPVIVYVYGGPAKQIVTNAWMGTTGLFHQLLARRGFAIFMLDNRGTPGRDRKFQTAIRRQFGDVEFTDQLAALDQLLAQYPQLDSARLGIWGWSNGGSLALYAMTHCDRFRVGVAIAPVTDWTNYASAYSERYLGLPSDHPEIYRRSSISNSVNHLEGDLLLVHGTSDDNVHFQNSMQLVEAMIESGHRFGLFVYPNKTHGIAGPAYRSHLFHAIEDHFEKGLK
jgi:dipeptidyl-peptidase-4